MVVSIKQLLKEKGNHVFSVSSTHTAYQALEVMAKNNVGALLILEGDKVAGIFSERDYARKVILKGKSSKETPISELMTKDVIFIDSKNTVDEGMVLMTDKRIRHLPVVENDKLIGLVSIGDIVKRIIDEQKKLIKELEKSKSSSG